MVRQDEVPWHGRVTVFLDSRTLATSNVFEDMVSAAASVAAASLSRGDHVRFLATDGTDSGFGVGDHHLDRLLTDLALIEPSSHPLGAALDQLTSPGSSGALITVTTGEDELDDAIMRRAAGRYRRRVLALFGSPDALPIAPETALRSTSVIRVAPGQAFADVWGREFGRPKMLAR